MSTTPLTDAIEALIRYANETTGASDTTLSDAVGTLVAGYGGGGGGSDLVDWLSNAITTLERSDVITIGNRAAQGHQITKIDLPNCTSIGTSGFQDCSGVTSASLPKCVTLGQGALRNCRLPGIVLPKCTSTGQDCFYQNGNGFTYADFGNATDNSTLTLGTWTFENLANFELLIIRYPVRAVMGNLNALQGTKFKSGGAGGDIYIPKSLYDHLGDGTADDYKAATNWSTYDGYGTITWHAIEGSQYETQYADGTPIE